MEAVLNGSENVHHSCQNTSYELDLDAIILNLNPTHTLVTITTVSSLTFSELPSYSLPTTVITCHAQIVPTLLTLPQNMKCYGNINMCRGYKVHRAIQTNYMRT